MQASKLQPSVLSQALRRTRGAFGTVALFSLALNVLTLASPLYMLQVYDRVLGSGKVETLLLLTAMLGVALMALAAIETLRTSVTVRIGAWLNQALGPLYLDSGIRARIDGRSYGGQAFRDLSTVQSFVATNGMTAFFDFPWTPLFIVVIWILHPWLGMLALVAAALLLLLSFSNEFATRRPLRTANDNQIAATRLAETAIGNAEAVTVLGMRRTLLARWTRMNADTQRDLLLASRRGGVVTGLSKFLRMFFQSGILGLGALLAIRGEITPGVMIAGNILLGRALAPMDSAMTAWKSFSSARIAYDRLRSQAEAYPPEPRRMSLPKPRGKLAVKDLTVVVGLAPVLKRVSFETEPGIAVAVVGPSAAGKSTLCKAIVGLIEPRGGSIQLDGVALGLWNNDELGPHIGYLPQEIGLFPGTIRENIARMQEASDTAVREAAELAHAHDMISKLPNGYETVIGEGGAGLSGGQRQRIGLARAVFGSPPLIVLDEPNANLDQTGEGALAEAILELKRRGSTLIIVGHRPSTLAQADCVLLLKDGVVQAFGPRNEVLDRMREAQTRVVKSEEKEAGSAAKPVRQPTESKDKQPEAPEAKQLLAERAALVVQPNRKREAQPRVVKSESKEAKSGARRGRQSTAPEDKQTDAPGTKKPLAEGPAPTVKPTRKREAQLLKSEERQAEPPETYGPAPRPPVLLLEHIWRTAKTDARR